MFVGSPNWLSIVIVLRIDLNLIKFDQTGPTFFKTGLKLNQLTTLELGKVSSATEAKFLHKLQPLVEVDFSATDVHTADLPKVAIDSVLLKAAVRLYFSNKKKNLYPFAKLQIADHAVVGQIISQNLPDNIRSEYFANIQCENAASIVQRWRVRRIGE